MLKKFTFTRFSHLILACGASASFYMAQAQAAHTHAKHAQAKHTQTTQKPSSPTTCHAPHDVHSAFNLAGLKSELMVTALSCQKQDQYNDFINHFRPFLQDSDKKLDSYFKSTYGRQAQKQRDDYITQLADVQSLGGLKSGTVFCDQRVPMFDEIAVLETADDLSAYAEAKDVAQPASYESCSAPHSSHGHARSRKSTHHGK